MRMKGVFSKSHYPRMNYCHHFWIQRIPLFNFHKSSCLSTYTFMRRPRCTRIPRCECRHDECVRRTIPRRSEQWPTNALFWFGRLLPFFGGLWSVMINASNHIPILDQLCSPPVECYASSSPPIHDTNPHSMSSMTPPTRRTTS